MVTAKRAFPVTLRNAGAGCALVGAIVRTAYDAGARVARRATDRAGQLASISALSRAVSRAVHPAGRRIAAHAVASSPPYRCPCPYSRCNDR